jgi:TRAP-type mannitol/chloroaromatic compound transport system permease small subunit
MTNFVTNFMTNFQFNNTLGVCLYWVPLVFCVVFYFVRTVRNYVHDKKQRELANKPTGSYYHPTDTVGSLIGRALVSIIPVANIWAAMFDLAPNVFGRLFSVIGNVFNQPLVPKKDTK